MGTSLSMELTRPNWEDRYSDDYSLLEFAIKVDGAFFFEAFLPPIVFYIIAFVIYYNYSKTELTVTDKRVFGRAVSGKRVDLPLDAISAVGTGKLESIAVSTSSGSIKFGFLANRDEIHAAISQLLIDRQAKPLKNDLSESKSTNADELKKYKELLDGGVITQEEFDAKKKQLLGL